MRIYFETNWPDTITIIYGYECSECDTKITQQWLGCQIVTPNFPAPGWVYVSDGSFNGRWVCPKHQVAITPVETAA